MSLEDLYKEVILDHYKKPRNKRDIESATVSCRRNNPLCGDEITIAAQIEGDLIADIGFDGQGCSISMASASMLTDALKGKTTGEAEKVAAGFRGMMSGELEPDEDAFGELVALKGVVKYPVRIKCAVLAWDVFQEALETGGASEGSASGSAPHGG